MHSEGHAQRLSLPEETKQKIKFKNNLANKMKPLGIKAGPGVPGGRPIKPAVGCMVCRRAKV